MNSLFTAFSILNNWATCINKRTPSASITYQGRVRYILTEASLNLSPGESTWISFPLIEGTGVPHELTARVWVDVPTTSSPLGSLGNVLEIDETNNHRSEGLRNTGLYRYTEVWAR